MINIKSIYIALAGLRTNKAKIIIKDIDTPLIIKNIGSITKYTTEVIFEYMVSIISAALFSRCLWYGCKIVFLNICTPSSCPILKAKLELRRIISSLEKAVSVTININTVTNNKGRST
jgi:hypothetical protein